VLALCSVYAGLSASIMRQAIYGTARIGLHRTFSNKLQEVRVSNSYNSSNTVCLLCKATFL
jgi:hypothetical protein